MKKFTKFLGSPAPFTEAIDIWGTELCKGQQNFLLKMGIIGIKRRRMLRRFQTYKLVLVAKCTYNKLFKTKCHFDRKKTLKVPYLDVYLQITFLDAFCKFTFWNLRKILLLLIPINPYCKAIILTHILYCILHGPLKVYTCAEEASALNTVLNIFFKQYKRTYPAWFWFLFQHQLSLQNNHQNKGEGRKWSRV
jgi:hypothetical protein